MQRARSDHKIYLIVTAIFVLFKLGVHFFTSTRYELHRDEMLYFNMADHLSFGYASVPPLTAFFAYIAKIIFGYSVFGIRFFPAMLGALSLVIIAKITRELGGGILALTMALTAFTLSPGFLLFNSALTPNVFEQFLWLLITYLLFRMATSKNEILWVPLGIFVGLAFLTKYSIIFFITGFALAFLFSEHRKLMFSAKFLLAIFVALLIFFPNILWQYNNNWPVLHHMSELKKTQLDNMNAGSFFRDLISLNSIATLTWMIGLLSLLVHRSERNNQFIGVASAIVIALFLFSNGKAYYIMGLFPFLFAAGAVAMERDIPKILNLAFIAITVFVLLITMPFVIPVLTFDRLDKYAAQTNHRIVYPFSRWEDGKDHGQSQVFADMTGWKELASYVAKAYQQLSPSERSMCTIYAQRNYGYAGAIHFYGKAYGVPDAVTFLESYVYWAPDSIPNGPVIYIHYEINGLKDKFRNITEVGVVENKYFREKGVKVYLCREPLANISELYKQEKQKAETEMRSQ